MEYRYALVNRPAMLGAVPRGFIRIDPRPAVSEDHHDIARHGIIVYAEPLTDDDAMRYELRPLIDGADRLALAERIAASFNLDDQAAIVRIAGEDVDDARGIVFYEIDKIRPIPSIGNPATFADLVLERLMTAT